jgi:hypothetical protein
MLHCPECQGDHITVHSRWRYFAWTVLCLVIISLSYVALMMPLLDPGEWNIFKMGLILFCQAAFCIGLVMVFYYFVTGIFKKHTSYRCQDCDIEFDSNLVVQHHAHHQH